MDGQGTFIWLSQQKVYLVSLLREVNLATARLAFFQLHRTKIEMMKLTVLPSVVDNPQSNFSSRRLVLYLPASGLSFLVDRDGDFFQLK